MATAVHRAANSLGLAALMLAALGRCAAQAPAPPEPLPGQLVDAGGYRVHLYCIGQGNPTVMVVGAGFSFDWGLVQPGVAKFTKICTYDASGTAWSDPGPVLSCAARVNEIHTLLKSAKLEGPYVFAGLSIGALVARVYCTPAKLRESLWWITLSSMLGLMRPPAIHCPFGAWTAHRC